MGFLVKGGPSTEKNTQKLYAERCICTVRRMDAFRAPLAFVLHWAPAPCAKGLLGNAPGPFKRLQDPYSG